MTEKELSRRGCWCDRVQVGASRRLLGTDDINLGAGYKFYLMKFHQAK